jgi:alkaline phosphatase D
LPRIWTSLAVSLATSALILIPGPKSVSSSTARKHGRQVWPSRAVQLVAGSTRLSDRRTSYLNLAINLLCTAMCLDFIYRSHYLLPSTQVEFSRMGYVTHDSARIALRSDGGDIRVTYGSEGEPMRAASTSMRSGDTDQTTQLLLEALRSNTAYHYNTSTGLEGTFTTRSAPEDMSRFSILSTSCQKPNWPYSPLNHPLRIQGMEYLDQYLASSGLAPDMMLFLGDFICTLPCLPLH